MGAKRKIVLIYGWRQMTLPPSDVPFALTPTQGTEGLDLVLTLPPSGVPFAVTPTQGTEGPDLVLTVRVWEFDVVGSDPSQR